jgi:hypothetical protein
MSNYIISTETTARENGDIGVVETQPTRTETKSTTTGAYNNADFGGDAIDPSVQPEIRDIIGDSDTRASPQEFHTPTSQRSHSRPSTYNWSDRVPVSRLPTTDEIIPVALFGDHYEDLNDTDQDDFKLIPPSPSGFINDDPPGVYNLHIENPFITAPAVQREPRTPIANRCSRNVRRELVCEFERSR